MSEPSEPTVTITASTPDTKPASTKKIGSTNRLPTLNQLAARINSTKADAGGGAPQASNTTSAPRPRLAAFALRTGSQTSLSTAASNADSTAVNPPSTRSASPAMSSTSQASNATTNAGGASTPLPEGGEPLTQEKLEALNEENGTVDKNGSVVVAIPLPEQPKKKIGYKNIPSLDAITARIAKQRAMSLSIDGSAMPPEPEMVEDPKTPGVQMKAPEHPLQFSWTIYHDTKAKFPFTPATAAPHHQFQQPAPGTPSTVPIPTDAPYSATHPPESTEYEAGLTVIGDFETVEEFCRYFNWLKPPSKLEKNSNYHIFKSGIKPMWEDPANAAGGKWVLTMKNNPALLDRCWSWLAFALVGEELEEGDEVCGAVVSLRSKVDRIQVWTRGKDDVEKLNRMGKRLVKLLDVSEADNIGLEFQYNSDDRPPPNKFLSIQAVPMSGFRSSFQTSTPSGAGPSPLSTSHTTGHAPTRSFGGGAGEGAGSAFGGFGTGAGIGAWKAGATRKV